jgi:peroxiredoxin Q/BCP
MWPVLLVVIAVVIALFLASRSLSSRTMPGVGSIAPDFSLTSQDGKQVSLQEFRGKWVVLYFYPKDFTSGCTMEAHNFQRDQAEFGKRNAVILGISVDSAESHRRFCAKEGLNFKLLADTSHRVSSEYGSLMNLLVTKISARNTFLIDPQGKIVRAFASMNPARHSAEMLSTLDTLQAQLQTK